MEASTPKMSGPGASRPPEPTEPPRSSKGGKGRREDEIPEWFVGLYNQQFQGGKGGVSRPWHSQRRGPGQDYMEMAKYWRVLDEARRLRETNEQLNQEAWHSWNSIFPKVFWILHPSRVGQMWTKTCYSRWWFHIYFIFSPTWGSFLI